MKTPVLETARLILRPVTLYDVPAIQKHFNHWDIIKYIANSPWPYPSDGALTHIRDTVLPLMEEEKMHAWAITLKGQDGKFVGLISFHFEGDDNRGFWLALEFHRQGLMTEAVTIVNDFIFDVLGVERFKVRNMKSNIGSHKIKEKTGGRVVAETVERFANGRVESMEIWEITKQSWAQAKSAF